MLQFELTRKKLGCVLNKCNCLYRYAMLQPLISDLAPFVEGVVLSSIPLVMCVVIIV